MKVCKRCNIEKELSEYYKIHKGKYFQSHCKTCHQSSSKKWMKAHPEKSKQWSKEYYEIKPHIQKEYYESLKDGLYYVYMKKDNYVGATDCIVGRSIQHKQILCVLYSTPSVDKASELEEFLHDLGYKGRGRKTYAQQFGSLK